VKKRNSLVHFLFILFLGIFCSRSIYTWPPVRYDEYGGIISDEAAASQLFSRNMYGSMTGHPDLYAMDGYRQPSYGSPMPYDIGMAREHADRYAEELLYGDHEMMRAPRSYRPMLEDSQEALRMQALAQFDEDDFELRRSWQERRGRRVRFWEDELDDDDDDKRFKKELKAREKQRKLLAKSFAERDSDRQLRRSRDAEFAQLLAKVEELEADQEEMIDELQKAQKRNTDREEDVEKTNRKLAQKVREMEEELQAARDELVDKDLDAAAIKIQRTVRAKSFSKENKEAVEKARARLGDKTEYIDKITELLDDPTTDATTFVKLFKRKELSDGVLASHPFSPAMLHTLARSTAQTMAELNAQEDSPEKTTAMANLKKLQNALEARRKQENDDAMRRLEVARTKLSELEGSESGDEKLYDAANQTGFKYADDSVEKGSRKNGKALANKTRTLWTRTVARKAAVKSLEQEVERLKKLKKVTKPSGGLPSDEELGKRFTKRPPAREAIESHQAQANLEARMDIKRAERGRIPLPTARRGSMSSLPRSPRPARTP